MSETKNQRVAVAGASGRMGRELVSGLIDGVDGLELSAATVRPESQWVGRDAGELDAGKSIGVTISADLNPNDFDLLIDFTNPTLSKNHCDQCREHQKPLVIGTTGFDSSQLRTVEQAANEIPIVLAPNMSIGVNILFHLLAQVTQAIGEQADIEITETHHRNKLDAPSGTALRMGEVIADSLGANLNQVAVYSRQGMGEPRKPGTIGFTSLRAGDVIGDHTALFATEGERLEISHKASSRQIYAQGAFRAAIWVSRQPAGLYSMQNVLGLASQPLSE
jgi:4-hydroxy-tetrahydrodipicolinate reductase